MNYTTSNELMRFTHNGVTITLIGVTIKIYWSGKLGETIVHRSRRAALIAYADIVSDEVKFSMFSKSKPR